ncbi:MAG TPA: hypothetical protein VK082_08220 [Paenalcaligenes sp.]|nr:hypothetical protein [Paenalcaligenes sp.]
MTIQTFADYEHTHLNFDAQEQGTVISAGNHYFYRYGSVLLDISHQEFQQILDNPHLYYFSTALKIHQRLKRLHAAYQVLVQPYLDGDPLAKQTLPYKYEVTDLDADGVDIKYEVVRIRIRQSDTDPHLGRHGISHLQPSSQTSGLSPDNRQNYWAEVIRTQNHFYYRIGNTLIDISKDDYCRVIENPNLYHLSTALYLHRRVSRINKIKSAEGIIG